MEFKHIPVLKKEVIEGLALKDGAVYVDGTVGGGGHSFEILNKTQNTKLFAFDKDEEALSASKARLAEFGDRVHFEHMDFKDAPKILKSLGVDKVDGVLLDLGVSSYQLDNGERGFSINKDARIDMRMDSKADFDGYYVANFYTEAQLTKIFKEYGEEPFAKHIARNMVIYRNKMPVETTGELAKIIDLSVPHYKNKNSIDNQRRIFQAIRIEVNQELAGLDEAVRDFCEMLAPGGRMCVISFHSLEDRCIKQTFADLAKDCICPPKTPVCICGHKATIRQITKKPITASAEELNINSRASSAKLRIAEKI